MEKSVKVYDRENFSQLIVGVKVVRIHKIEEAIENKLDTQIPKAEDLYISNSLSCFYCKVSFEDNILQRQHYKSDWHRYNLKLNLKSLEPLSEDKFDQLADDVSSISGSDTESEDNSEKSNKINALYQGKIYFKNDNGNIFSMYRALLHEKKDAPENDETLLKIVKQFSRNSYWTIFMLGGGHFAGAVFDGNTIVVHKTFHCYTVRAKQGGSQASKDNKSGGFKSAGSSLRRYNEQSLVQHIGELLETWNKEIDKSTLIFYHAAGTYNRSVLFGGRTPILKKNDTRLRSIPFATKRATFTEVKRVHEVLSTLDVYTSIETIKTQFALKVTEEESARIARKEVREALKSKTINRAKSRESKESTRLVPGENISSSESENENGDFELSTENLELSFEGLQEFEDTVSEANKKKKVVKKKKPKRKDRTKKWEEMLKRNLYNACCKGNLEELKDVLNGIKIEEGNELTPDKAVNLAVDEHGNTVLHIAAMKNHSELIIWLMENNSCPCNKNDKFQTPYIVNADKEIRNVFRGFALVNPDKYNYPKAQIPVIIPTMTEEEQAEKKRAQRKVKREREKEKRKEQEVKRKEEDDRNRFLKLSDREKMALAAERRMLAVKSVLLVRCFLCGEDMSGKVPFEYSGNRFCSITCLKAHRMQTPVVLS